jgi:threonine aldolase
MEGFPSDNCSGAHPAVLEAMVVANAEHAVAHGTPELVRGAVRWMCSWDTTRRKPTR